MSQAIQAAIAAFTANVRKHTGTKFTNPDEYNLYVGLADTARSVEFVEVQLDEIKQQLARVAAQTAKIEQAIRQMK